MHDKITILLATYNGATYLEEQLRSIIKQSAPNCKIIASDDGSTDKTCDILQQYQIETVNSPKQGFAANFLSLLARADNNSKYYAFADQDDVWDLDKISRATKALADIPPDIPALYCSRTMLVDETLKKIGYSPLFDKKPGFKNALVQSIAGGNTMVFNLAALQLLKQATKFPIVSHDWWAYLLISGAGGQIIYDAKPHIYYRQHNQNIIGSNNNLTARFHRIKMLFQGRLRTWIDKHINALSEVSHLLTTENKKILADFQLARQSNNISRMVKFYKIGLYRQTTLGQLGLVLAAIFNKI